MLYLLGHLLEPTLGPFRLLYPRSSLIVLGLYLGFIVTFVILPRTFPFLPRDRGREFASQAAAAKGKPTGAGIIFVPLFVLVSLIVLPFSFGTAAILALTLITCVAGYMDDSSGVAWGEYLKGTVDLVLAILASLVTALTVGTTIWLPFVDGTFALPTPAFVVIGTVLIWVSVNSTNCSDGVDGLSGTLALIGLASLGIFMHTVLGNAAVTKHLLLPFVESGPEWSMLTSSLAGCVAAYLWYNAHPSRVLMGDAGSRSLGFLIGVLILISGNPVLLVVFATVLLVNGGTGLVKVTLLRFLKIRVFPNTKFPLHDHVRETRNWSNAQVVARFSIIQIMIIVGLMEVILKAR